MNPITRITSLLTALLVLASCSDSSKDMPTVNIYQDIVTFTSSEANRVSFEFQVVDDSPAVMLYAPGSIDTKTTPPGTRLMLTYSPADGQDYGESGAVNVRALSKIYNVELNLLDPGTLDGWDNEPIAITTLWRSGCYINMFAQVANSTTRTFYLIPDMSTIGSSCPDLYLSTQSTTGDAPAYMTRTAASFDISELWDREDLQGVKIHVANATNPYNNVFTFNKQ